VEELDASLTLKVGKIITSVGAQGLKQLGQTRKALREASHRSLLTGRVYILQPHKTPAATT
jgi:hypothetical protein